MLRGSTHPTMPAAGQRSWYGRIPATVLLSAGVAMFAWYILMDVVASLAYSGYSYKDQTISELSAMGAPTRPFWLAMSIVYQAMAFAFAFGVLRVAGERRRVRIVGWLLLATAVSGIFWWLGPMHQREVLAADGGTWQDTLHLALGGVSSILFFGMIGVGAGAFGKRFLAYSLATIAVMFVFGMLMNMDIEAVGNDEPTPWLGIWERIAIEGAMLWQAVFAAMLLRHVWPSRTGDERNGSRKVGTP